MLIENFEILRDFTETFWIHSNGFFPINSIGEMICNYKNFPID